MYTLVFHQGALGDTVLTWPLLRGMGRVRFAASWGKARLTQRWLAEVEALDGESPDCARLFVPAGSCEAGDSLLGLLRGAERVVSFISNGRDAWAANVRAVRGSRPTVFLPHRPPEGGHEPVTMFHARWLDEGGLPVPIAHPTLRRNPDGPVVIHPGSGGRDKCWPMERFNHLVRHFQRIGRPVQILWGEAERHYLGPQGLHAWRDVEVVEPPDWVELSLHISRASVFVGNDSGPTHLAAQLGVPTVALFGPSDARVWAPVGPAVRIVCPARPEPMDWLSPETVIEAVAGMS